MSSDEGSVVEAPEPVDGEFETEEVENVENEAEEANEEQAQDDENKKVVKPKRVIKNPQPKLNEQTLRGPKGLTALQSYFDKVQFKGKGYEDQDLNVVMKTYEYWCHRMFPKYPFDASIARLEALGAKRATVTYMKRIRQDLIFDDEDKAVQENDNEDIPTEGFVDPVDTTESQFDQLLSNSRSNVVPTNQITEEQLERIRQNKERAEKLRQDRMRRIREKAAGNLEEPSYLSRESTTKENIFTSQDCQSNTVDVNSQDTLEISTVQDILPVAANKDIEIDTRLDEINGDKMPETLDDDIFVNENGVVANKYILDREDETENDMNNSGKNEEQDNIENILDDINSDGEGDDIIVSNCKKNSNQLLDDKDDIISSNHPVESMVAENYTSDDKHIGDNSEPMETES